MHALLAASVRSPFSFALDPVSNSFEGWEPESLVYGDVNSWQWKIFYYGLWPTLVYESAGLVGTPWGTTQPIIYSINPAQNSVAGAKVGRTAIVPDTGDYTFEIVMRRAIVGTPSAPWLAIFAADGTTLLAHTVCNLTAADALYSVTVTLAAGTEVVLAILVNDAGLGIAQAHAIAGPCRFRPVNPGSGVFSGPFWGVERLVIPFNPAHPDNTSPGSSVVRTWGKDPYESWSYPQQYLNLSFVRESPWVVRMTGGRAAAEFALASDTADPWSRPFIHEAPNGATQAKQFVPVAGFQGGSLQGGSSLHRTITQFNVTPGEILLAGLNVQDGSVIRLYIPRAVGSRFEPEPLGGSRFQIWGDSIPAGFPLRCDLSWPMLIRTVYPGSVYNIASGGDSLNAWGYGATGGVLNNAPSDQARRAQLLATWNAFNPTAFYIEMGTNDYAIVGTSAANYAVGLAAVCDNFHAAFPTAQLYVQTLGTRTDTGPNAAGSTAADFRVAATAVVAARPWATLVDGTALYTVAELFDNVHPNAAGQSDAFGHIRVLLGV